LCNLSREIPIVEALLDADTSAEPFVSTKVTLFGQGRLQLKDLVF